MLNASTNPLYSLTKDELNQFRKAIDKNFIVIKVKEKITEDYETKWLELHSHCLKYAYWNYKTITKGYPENVGKRTYGDIVKIMINQELKKD
jgi:hypothetical protein